MKTLLMLMHVGLAATATYVAIYLTGEALLSLNHYVPVQRAATTQASTVSPESSLLQAQLHAWQLGFVALLTTGLALRFRRPAWRVATVLCWVGVLYLLLRFAIRPLLL